MLKVYLLLIALLGFQTLKSHANQLSEAQMYFPSSIPDSTFNTPMPSISSLNRQQINSKEPMIVYLPIQSQIPNTPPQFAPYVLHANGEIFTLAVRIIVPYLTSYTPLFYIFKSILLLLLSTWYFTLFIITIFHYILGYSNFHSSNIKFSQQPK